VFLVYILACPLLELIKIAHHPTTRLISNMKEKKSYNFPSSRTRFFRAVRNQPGSLIAFVVLSILLPLYFKFLKQRGPGNGPPKWIALREHERTLPQHNLSLALPEGRDGRFVKFSNAIVGLGWNNVLNEMYVTHMRAHQTDH
jgi:hypothetical protein